MTRQIDVELPIDGATRLTEVQSGPDDPSHSGIRSPQMPTARTVSPMRLFVDDLRPAPDDTWTVAQTSAEALEILRGGAVEELSLDHDLGGEDTARPIVLWLAEHGGWPATVRVHSANPVGVEWITGMVERYGPGITPQ